MHVPRGSLGGHDHAHHRARRARRGRNYRGTARNPTLRRRLYNAKTSPTCAVALIKSRSGIFAVPFISGYYLLAHQPRAAYALNVRLRREICRNQRLLFSGRARRFRTLHHRIFTRGRLSFISPLTAANALSSFIACNMHDTQLYVYVYSSIDARIKRVSS